MVRGMGVGGMGKGVQRDGGRGSEEWGRGFRGMGEGRVAANGAEMEMEMGLEWTGYGMGGVWAGNAAGCGIRSYRAVSGRGALLLARARSSHAPFDLPFRSPFLLFSLGLTQHMLIVFSPIQPT